MPSQNNNSENKFSEGSFRNQYEYNTENKSIEYIGNQYEYSTENKYEKETENKSSEFFGKEEHKSENKSSEYFEKQYDNESFGNQYNDSNESFENQYGAILDQNGNDCSTLASLIQVSSTFN